LFLGRYLPIIRDVRRKAGTLVPLELSILEAGLSLEARGQADFHGYLLARHLGEVGPARRLVAHGTLYKALDRLERAGLIGSRWEEPETARAASRPRRRLYRVTAAGAGALARARRGQLASGALRTEPAVN
jgi:DNA-binding PadR family transcriptional regulator